MGIYGEFFFFALHRHERHICYKKGPDHSLPFLGRTDTQTLKRKHGGGGGGARLTTEVSMLGDSPKTMQKTREKEGIVSYTISSGLRANAFGSLVPSPQGPR